MERAEAWRTATEAYCGLVFSLRPSPTACFTSLCDWAETVLYEFANRFDAIVGVPAAFDQAGNLYGVSYYNSDIFELTPSAGGWTESILYKFASWGPTGLLLGNDGNLYGTTVAGGDLGCTQRPGGCGTVFQLAPSGNGWTETVLYAFHGEDDGYSPSSLVQDSSGNLYGISTVYGGWTPIVFMLSPSDGKWVLKVLSHNLGVYDSFSNLTIDAAGNLYGTGGFSSASCGSSCFGYIFKLVNGSDGWQYTTPVYFSGEQFPTSGTLELDAQGNLYGTTVFCGEYYRGTVWQFSP